MSRLTPNQRTRLKALLGIVFVALLAPAAVLAWLGYRQVQYEAFYLQQTLAAELTQRIDSRAAALFGAEDGRPFVDFSFLIVGEGDFVQRSPLSGYPVEDGLPGLVSYFQVDAEGAFSTPLLPTAAETAISAPENLPGRQALQDRIRLLLAGTGSPDDAEERVTPAAVPLRTPAEVDGERELDESKKLADVALDVLVEETDPGLAERAFADKALVSELEPIALDQTLRDYRQQAELAQGQRAFERLNAPKEKTDSPLGSVSDLQLEERFAKPASVTAEAAAPSARDEPSDLAEQSGRVDIGGKLEQRRRRSEKSIAYSGDRVAGLASDGKVPDDQPLTIFESEVDPFRFELLDKDHFVLHRTAWRDGQRFVQGAIIEREAFVEDLFAAPFRESALTAVGSLVIAHRGEVLQSYSGPRALGYVSAGSITGTLLYRSRLTAPLTDLELIFGFTQLPVGPGGMLIGWTVAVFVILLVAGFLLLYRVGQRQIALGEQQRDFVSAVSHELKTPLTSIRMYGEMLKAGWASEEKRREYYEFIFSESERLTRLINNVLRLARFDRNGSDLDLRSATVGELVDLARSKIASQIEQAGFELEESHERPDAELEADADAFVQIAINLVDNALKFSAGAETKKITFASRIVDGQVEFSVRDYGPGVPKSQMKRIFELFYRTERELTRETVGTGIGLALVHELAAAMGGSVDVVNAVPGAEFRVRLPLAE